MLSERRGENTENKKLAEQFENPFDHVDQVEICSSSEAEVLIQDITSKISNRDDWAVRAEGIKLATSCLKGGIYEFFETDYSFMASEIAACVTDLRSALVRSGALLIAASAATFKESYVTSINIIVPALFKQLTHGTSIIANSCHFALLSIARNCQHPKTITTFLTKSQSKSAQHRSVVAEAILIAMTNWPRSMITALNSSFDKALTLMKDDASQIVRKVSKSALSYMKGENVPENSEGYNDCIKTVQTPKQYKNSSIKNNNKAESLKKASTKSPKCTSTPTKPQFTPKKQSENTEYSPIKAIMTPDAHASLTTDFSPNPPCQKNPEKKIISKNNKGNNLNNTNSVKFELFEDSCKLRTPKKAKTPTKRDMVFTSSQQIRQQKQMEIEQEETDELEYIEKPQGRTPQRNVRKIRDSPRNVVQPRQRKIVQKAPEIDSFMPPKTMDDAESFQKCLINIIETESFDKFNGIEDLLSPSIISAANFIPEIGEWDSIIPVLFESYPEEFKQEITALIIAFRCDEWLVLTAIEYYGSKLLIDEFISVRSTQLQYSFKFFTIVIAQQIEFDMNEKLLKFLRRLVEFNKGTDGAQIISELVGCKPVISENQSLEITIMKLKGRTNCTREAEILNEKIAGNPSLISSTQEYLYEELRPLIEEGNNGQIFAVYEFIMKIPSISFVFLVEPILKLLLKDDRELQEKSRICMLNLMEDRFVLSMVLDFLAEIEDDDESMEESIMNLILQYFQISSAQVLEPLFAEIFSQLLPLLDSESTVVRRIVVLIFVEFKYKVPQIFSKFNKKISSKHQKIIELYLSKRKLSTPKI